MLCASRALTRTTAGEEFYDSDLDLSSVDDLDHDISSGDDLDHDLSSVDDLDHDLSYVDGLDNYILRSIIWR